jgi:hypothetical protein
MGSVFLKERARASRRFPGVHHDAQIETLVGMVTVINNAVGALSLVRPTMKATPHATPQAAQKFEGEAKRIIARGKAVKVQFQQL